MEQIEFQFMNVLVIADRPDNIFSQQLSARGINFVSSNSLIPMEGGFPDLILVINRKLEEAVRLKSQVSDVQVVHCQGGRKQFSPRVRIIFSDGEYDAHWFSSWDNFISIIGHRQEPRPKLITPLGNDEYAVISPATEVGPDVSQTLYDLYWSMLAVSRSYLDWCTQWEKDVTKMVFSCHFSLSTKKRGTVKQLTMPIFPEISYQGRPVISEDDKVFFVDETGRRFAAIVKFVLETEVVFILKKPLPRRTINRLVSFTVKINQAVMKAQHKICTNMVKSIPPNMWEFSGRIPRHTSRNFSTLRFSKEAVRKLLDDQSQLRAVLDMCSSSSLNLVHGPAGTGKTSVTSQVVRQHFKEEKTILVVSHSNKGLDTLLEFVVQDLGDPYHSQIFRLGNDQDSVNQRMLAFHRSKRFAYDARLYSSTCGNPVMREVDYIKMIQSDRSGLVLGCTMASYLVDETLEALPRGHGALGFQADVVIIDEASRGFLFELLPIVAAAKEKTILIGDPDQLGNLEITPEARQYLEFRGHSSQDIEMFCQGWFNWVLKQSILPADLLCINRRSLPMISDLVSRLFYGGKLISGRFDPENQGSVILCDTSTAQDNGEKQKGTSWMNSREANLVVDKMVRLLLKGYTLEDIGVITPYRSQIELIRGRLRQSLSCDNRLAFWRKKVGFEESGFDIEQILNHCVNTVDAFQGSQRKVIILSMVRSNSHGEIGFNQNINRLRVAFSRAEDSLIIVANAQTFLDSSVAEVREIFSKILEFTKANGTYVTAP